MKFPIVLNNEEERGAREEAARSGRPFYVVAANGVFQVRRQATHESVTRVTGDVPGLHDEREALELYVPRLPTALLEEVIGFFDEIYQRYRGEAIVILFYREETREFRVGVPPQRIGGYWDSWGRYWPDLHLEYDEMERPEGFLRFGTIHSHAAGLAYASHADCEDERYGDGLHIVFGSFAATRLSQEASFVAGGRRFRLAPETVLEPCEIPDRPVDPAWLEAVDFAVDTWHPRPVKTYGPGPQNGGGNHGH